jgi:hypothetical protein
MSVLDPCETEDAVDRQRDSSGHAPRAGVGDVSGDGDSQRKDGGSSFVVAMARPGRQKAKTASKYGCVFVGLTEGCAASKLCCWGSVGIGSVQRLLCQCIRKPLVESRE